MLRSASSARGMVTAPHHLAAQAGLAVLREGGNAIEAMIATAATIAVVYPHMNSLGGDGFWLIKPPGRAPVAISAGGAAARRLSRQTYHEAGLEAIPARGPLAAITVAGAVSGWDRAYSLSAELGGSVSRQRLLEDAIWYAEHGFPVTGNQAEMLAAKWDELAGVPGFASAFPAQGAAGDVFKQPRLAATLGRLAAEGFDGFYRGRLAASLASDLERAGSPLSLDDLHNFRAEAVAPLALGSSRGTVFNTPPPTQGLASLMILGMFDRLGPVEPQSFAYVHGLVEATKRAFVVRDREICDPAFMSCDPASFLSNDCLDRLAGQIDPRRAMPWPAAAGGGDTVWMGAIDADGLAVSYIQSLYWEFGSGVVLDETGVLWQNRGAAFALAPHHPNALEPGKRPLHTLNPALAELSDGSLMVYGTMGGEGQPQTQAAIFTRVAHYGNDLQAAITAPRWLLGRTWGVESTTLKLEAGFPVALTEALESAGHTVEVVPDFSQIMGHAGGVIRRANGMFDGANDPRSDGGAAGY